MTTIKTERRHFITISGTVMAGLLAGCTGDDSLDEIESLIETSLDHVEEAHSFLEPNTGHIHDDEWQTCLNNVEDARPPLEDARQEANEAQDLAEQGEHTDHVAATEHVLEYIDIYDQITDEYVPLCEAGMAGDDEEAEDRWDTVQTLDGERMEKEGEVFDALEEIGLR